MAVGFAGGARLMRASFDVVRRRPALLWFPVLSTLCLVLTAGFWIFEGAWLYSIGGSRLLYVLLALATVYSLTFVGVFFGVAAAGAAAQVLDGGEPSVGDGLDVAWSRLGSIAGWAACSLAVSLVVSFLGQLKGMRWIARIGQLAWSFATLFVVPLIALEGLDALDARRRSFELARADWAAEAGGLGLLRAALIIPGLVLAVDGELLFRGYVHSTSGRAVLVCGLLAGFGLAAVVAVVRMVFAVSLYRADAEPARAALIA